MAIFSDNSMQPADFPVGGIEQKRADLVAARIHLFLAGIRAGKFNRLTFPCKAQWLSEAVCRVKRRLLTVAGAAHVGDILGDASCFPFNCAHEHARGHQNPSLYGFQRAASTMTASP
jgi:hypothetical protein